MANYFPIQFTVDGPRAEIEQLYDNRNALLEHLKPLTPELEEEWDCDALAEYWGCSELVASDWNGVYIVDASDVLPEGHIRLVGFAECKYDTNFVPAVRAYLARTGSSCKFVLYYANLDVGQDCWMSEYDDDEE